MSTSKHAFDQVKSILGKLDRSIDAARARRLEPAAPAVQPTIGEAKRENGLAGGPEIPVARAIRSDTPQMLATPLPPRTQPRLA
ncbi:MAG: hypothetical protein KF745_05455 [Phycisphaeraceae bacterium]|nr:hypothetical protein [Phycisphaeraceae bacterium]